ncbi:hypothetical protein LCM4577_23620 [Mesorhizobium sp. LCM 4577]|nr:hypothetical protein LCM4576_25965 [Mesorhizobium sp. LCM 4576]OHV69063.1 hypothetical protein LCM4577_23620 [Mesorhizobium sp. LCM 4577]
MLRQTGALDGASQYQMRTRRHRRLVEQTGITEAQAHELALQIGLNWNSLMREAKLIAAGARAEVARIGHWPRIDGSGNGTPMLTTSPPCRLALQRAGT